MDREAAANRIAMMREVYDFIDQKTTSFVDTEENLAKQLDERSGIEKKYAGKYFVILCIAATTALLIPICIVSALFSVHLYPATPFIAVLGAFLYKRNYEKKKMPDLLKTINKSIALTENERNDIMNLINQAYFNVNAELQALLRETDNEKFIEKLDQEGIPPECGNLVALDYMYCAIKKGYAESFPDALVHFNELKESLKSREDEKSQKLSEEIAAGELRAEYREGLIKHCKRLSEELNPVEDKTREGIQNVV